jgi:hypothetical protein
LKDRRATMAGEIVQFKQGIAGREEQLSHLDATLRILDPSYRADTIPPKRLRRVKLFRQRRVEPAHSGRAEAGREAAGQCRHRRGHVTEKGFGRPSIHALTRRVRANLSYLLRNKRVVKTGDRLTARWALSGG